MCMQTTIIAVAYDGGVVLGADSRTSMGKERVTKCVIAITSPIPERNCRTIHS